MSCVGLQRGTGFQPVACLLARTRRSNVQQSRSDLLTVVNTVPLAAASWIRLRLICLSTGITGWKPVPRLRGLP